MAGRVVVADVSPSVGEGRYPAKSVIGGRTPVRATVWCAGHAEVRAELAWQGPDDTAPRRTPMTRIDPGEDRWQAHFTPDTTGTWTVWVEGFTDPWRTWLGAITAKVAAGGDPADLAVEFEAGALLLERAGDAPLTAVATRLRRGDLLAADRLAAAMVVEPDLRERITAGPPRRFLVERERAQHGAWYEFFPRSTGGRDEHGTPVHGTFASAAAELPRIAAMGFDVVYLPPIHPIGHRHRKGRNNSPAAGPGDVGSPWAIGSAAGGHDAVHPELGTLDDFTAFVAAAAGHGLEVALDLALQCSPDHPWVTAHPEWFAHRPDGSIAYAENPPKRYQDVYPLDFAADPLGLYREILRVVLFWVRQGVRLFRVDNPHTKPAALWEWLIRQVRAVEPDVVFLAEAFTRPAVLYGLARLGFSQSYTYFTWRDTKTELTEFGRDLVARASELRPNLFVNTPDILPTALHHAGPAAFAVRAALAATLAPSWGVYSGFELAESLPLGDGSEEYRDSEKYELRPRDHAAASSLAPWIATLNQIRRAHPAFRRLDTLLFHDTDDDAVLAYSRTDPATGDTVLIVVNLDPDRAVTATVRWDLAALGLPPDLLVRNEPDGRTGDWAAAACVDLDPAVAPALIMTVVSA